MQMRFLRLVAALLCLLPGVALAQDALPPGVQTGSAASLQSLDLTGNGTLVQALGRNQVIPINGLVGQGAATTVSGFLQPTPVAGRHYSLAIQMSAGASGAGDKVPLFLGAETGTGGSDVWSFNNIVSWRPGDPDVNVQGQECDFNNMNSAVPLNPLKLKACLNITSGGLYSPGYGIFIDASNKGTNSWRKGIHINRGAVSDIGLSVSAVNTGLTGTIVGGQLANGGDTLLMQRATDTSPSGYFVRFLDAANTTNLWTVDAGTVRTAIGASSSLAQLHLAPPTAPAATPLGLVTALGLENNSNANSTNKSVAMAFYGRDTTSSQKITGYVQSVPGNSNLTDADIVLHTRLGDVTGERWRLRNNGHISPTGTAPTLSSCGTSPTISGTDVAGQIATGTGATACTMTFAAAYVGAPYCVVTGQSAAVTYSITNTALTITAGAGVNINYHCTARSGG